MAINMNSSSVVRRSSRGFFATARLLSLGALVGFSLLSNVTNAATITWGAATTASADTDVLNTGTFVQALNFGASGGNTTVNGVSFTSINSFSYGSTVGSGAGSVVFGNASYVDNGGLSSYNGFGSSTAPYSNLSTNYKNLLGSAVYRETGTTSNLLLTINGLTIGQNYRVQFWSNDARGSTRTTTFSAVTGVTLDQNSLDADGGPGQFVTGFFTANATTQDVLLTTTAGSTSLVSAYSLSAVSAIPEPSTYAALAGAIVLVGTAVIRRRRSQR